MPTAIPGSSQRFRSGSRGASLRQETVSIRQQNVGRAIRSEVRRLAVRHGYGPDKKDRALQIVPKRAGLLAREGA